MRVLFHDWFIWLDFFSGKVRRMVDLNNMNKSKATDDVLDAMFVISTIIMVIINAFLMWGVIPLFSPIILFVIVVLYASLAVSAFRRSVRKNIR